MQLAVADLAPLYDDDFANEAVRTSIWDLDDSQNATLLWALNANAPSGELEMDLSATNDAWGRIQGVQNPIDAAHRPMAMCAFKAAAFDSDDDTLKVEFGFASALGAADNNAEDSAGGGQVLVKATPTGNVQDFSVVCLDTDDNLFWDVVGDDDATTVTTNVSASVPWDSSQGSTNQKAVTAQTTIAFVDNGASEDTITDSGNDFAKFAVGDFVQVSGSESNNGTYEVTIVAAGTLTLTVGVLQTEAAGESVTVTASDLTIGDGLYQTLVCAQNENNEAYGWVNGHFIGRLVAGAPDNTVPETVHFYIQNRAAADLGMINVDYIKAWQERVAIS